MLVVAIELLELAGVFELDDDDVAVVELLLFDVFGGLMPKLALFREPIGWPLLALSMAAALLRTYAYGGGAGVDAGLAVLGGGSGGSDEFDVRMRYGLP